MKFRFALLVSLLLRFQQYSSGQTVTLSSPSSSSTNVNSVTTLFTISEPTGTPQQIQVVFTLTSGYGYSLYGGQSWTLTMKSNTPAPGSFTVTPTSLSSISNPFTASPTTSMPEGYYSAYCQYIRPAAAGGTLLRSTTRTNVYIDLYTEPPALMQPATSSAFSKIVTLYDSVPELYLSGSKSIVFSGADTLTLTMSDNTPKDSLITVRTDSIFTTSHIVHTSSSTLPDGTYTVTLSYADRFGHSAAIVTNTNVLIQTSTPAPSFVTPIANIKLNNPSQYSYRIPSKPLSGSVLLTFTSDSGSLYEFALSDTTSGTFNLPASIKTTVPSGTYSVDLRYRDYLSNPYDSVVANNVTLDFVTQTPILTLPTSFSEFSDSMNVEFTMPESYLPYTVKLILFKSGTDSVVNTLTLNNVTVGTDSFELQTKNLLNPSIIASLTSDSLADGTYDMVISYQDSLGNPGATSTVTSSIVIHTRTLAPTLFLPVASTAYNVIPIQYILPEIDYPGSVMIILTSAGATDTLRMIDATPRSTAFLNPKDNPRGTSPFVSATLDTLPDGVYSVTLSYQDYLGNPAASDILDSITIKTSTTPPVMTLPASLTTMSDSMNINFTLPEAASSTTLTFMGATTDTVTILLNPNAMTAGTKNFSINTKNIINYTYITSVTPNNVLPDDIYTVLLSYSDLLGNPAASVVADSVTIDTKTLSAMLTSPLNDAVVKSGAPVNLSFTLPETATSGTVQVTFTGSIGCTATLNATAAGSYSFAINPDSVGSSTGVANTGCTALPDGAYLITVSYQDALGNTVAVSNAGSFVIHRVTDAPQIIHPTSFSTSGATMNVSFNLPEAALNNVVNAELFGADTISMTFLTSGAGTQNFVLNCNNLSTTTGLANASVSKIPNGTYTFYISYQDTLGNPAASNFVANVIIDIVTQTPSLISPATSSTVAEQMNVKFYIPQTPLNGSAKLLFNAPGISDTLILKNISSDTNNFTLDTKNLFASVYVQSSTLNSLSSGIYTITLSYRDSSGDPAASDFVTNVNLDNTTQPPLLISPADSTVFGQTMSVIFDLPEMPLSGSVELIFNSNGFNDTLTLSNVSTGINEFTLNTKNILSSSHVFSIRPAATTFHNGIYSVTLSYRDYLGNTAASSSAVDVTINNTTVAPALFSPENNYMVSNNNPSFVLSFLIPETPLTGSVQAVFSGANGTDTLFFNITTAGNYSFTLNPQLIDTSLSIAYYSDQALADGSYNVVIEYQNALGDPAASSNTGTITLDHVTLSPTLIYPGSYSTNNSLINVEFNIPENALDNTAFLSLFGPDSISISLQTVGSGLQRFTLNGNNLDASLGLLSTSQSTIPDGIYNIILSYQDTLSNPMASTIENHVSVSDVTPPPVVTTTDISPDCSMNAELSTAITSDTNNLTIAYYSDATLTVPVGKQVNGAGTYYVKVTDIYGVSDTASIVVNSIPASPSAPATSQNTICSGSTTTLQASGMGTISWYDAATNGNWLGSGSNYITSALTANATFYAQDSTCVASASRTASNVTVNPLPVNTTTLIPGGITANQTNAIYQWLNCNNNDSPINGDVNQSIETGDGNYAVQITLNGCTDTSDCVTLLTTGIKEMKTANAISIYPNPVLERLVIENEGNNNNETVFEIFNAVGKLVFSGSFSAKTVVETSGFSAGVYLIKLESANSTDFKKFVKE